MISSVEKMRLWLAPRSYSDRRRHAHADFRKWADRAARASHLPYFPYVKSCFRYGRQTSQLSILLQVLKVLEMPTNTLTLVLSGRTSYAGCTANQN
jgi:hypothetical protein